MTLPKKLYRLSVKQGGPRLRYAQRGGGTFASLATMQSRMDDLNRAGVPFEVYETETKWKKVNLDET